MAGTKIEPRVLRGFRDYLPQEMIPRQRMLAVIERGFQRFGYSPLQTPALEYLDILMGKYGDEGSKLLYHFRDEGDREVALRYDLTVPLARVAAVSRAARPSAATRSRRCGGPSGRPAGSSGSSCSAAGTSSAPRTVAVRRSSARVHAPR
jgi:histidyl-tRNA synthetase